MRTCGISWSLAAILALAFFSEATAGPMPRIPGYPDIMSQILASTYASPSVVATGSRTLGESCGEYEETLGSTTSNKDDGDCGPGLECHFDPPATAPALPQKPGKCLKPNGATCMQDDDCKSGKCVKSVSNYAYNPYHIPGAGSLLTMGGVCNQAPPLYTMAQLNALLSKNTGSANIALPHDCDQHSEDRGNNPGDCKSHRQCIWVPDVPVPGGSTDIDKCLHKTEFLYIKLQNALNRRGKNKFSLQISYASQPAPATMPYGPYGPTVIQSLYGNVKQGYPPRQYGGYGQSYGGYGQSYGGYGQTYGGYGQSHGGYGQSYGGYDAPYSGYDKPYDVYEKPYDGYEKPYGGYEKPYGGYEKPYGGYEKPYGGYDVPRDGYEKPYGGYEKPYGGYEKPYGGYEKPYDGYDVPRDGYEKPYGGYDVPRDGYEKPYGGYEKPYGQETYPPSPNYDPKPQYGNGKYEETTYADTPYQPETYSEPPYQPETYSEPPYQPETYDKPYGGYEKPYGGYDKPYGGYGQSYGGYGQSYGGYGQSQYVGYGHQQSYSGYDRPYGRRPYSPPRGRYGKGSHSGHPQEKPPTTPTPETEPASAEVEPDFS